MARLTGASSCRYRSAIRGLDASRRTTTHTASRWACRRRQGLPPWRSLSPRADLDQSTAYPLARAASSSGGGEPHANAPARAAFVVPIAARPPLTPARGEGRRGGYPAALAAVAGAQALALCGSIAPPKPWPRREAVAARRITADERPSGRHSSLHRPPRWGVMTDPRSCAVAGPAYAEPTLRAHDEEWGVPHANDA